MTEKMTIEMIAQQQGVLKTLDGFIKSLDKMDAKLDRVEKTSRRGARASETGWQKAGKAIRGAASELVGFQSLAQVITAGIRAITEEFEKIERIGKAAHDRAAGTGGSLRRLTANFSPDASVKSAADLAKRVQGISERTRTPIGQVAGAAETALSARGSADVGTALDAVEQAFRAFPGEGEIVNELASRSLDLAKQAGTKDTRVALGALTQTQQAARVTDLAKLGASAPRATLATVQGGGTVEQGLELFSAITSLAGDAEGRRSATAQVGLEGALKNFVLSRDDKKDPKGFITAKSRKDEDLLIPESQMDAFQKLGTGLQRLEFLQQRPELAEAFIAANPPAKESEGAIVAMVTGSKEALEELRSAQQKISPLDNRQVQNFEKFVTTLDNLPFQDDLKAKQQAEANVESFQLDPTVGRTARVQEILRKTREQVNLPGLDIVAERQAQLDFRIRTGLRGQTPEQAGITQLEEIRQDSIFGRRSPEETKLINDQITILKGLLEEAKKNNANPGAKPNQPAAAINGR